MCLTSLRFTTSPDSAATCNANNFQIGFVDDDDWTSTLTWNQVVGSAALSNPSDKITFVAANLSTYSPTLADLDRFSENLKLNNGRLSFWVKRWCQSNAVRVSNAGIDDNAFRGNNFAYGRQERLVAAVARGMELTEGRLAWLT